MRRFILALAIAIPLFARADFGHDTIHDNIPGDATVGDILTVGGAVRQAQVDQTIARFAETGTVNAATNALHAVEADHAGTADEADLATRALSADAATRAGYAVEAGFATNAQHAAEADHAGTADEADLATRALSADEATIAGYATGALNATNAQHATVAEHANVADEATEAYHAETATRATTADHAAEADVAYRYIEVDMATNAWYAAEAGHATNAEYAVNAEWSTNALYATHADVADDSLHAADADMADWSIACETCVSYVQDDDRTDEEQGRARENIGLDEDWMRNLWSYAGFVTRGVQALGESNAFGAMISTNIENYVYSPTYLGWLGIWVDQRSYTSILGAWDDEDFVEKANAWGDERYAKAADTNAVHYTEDLGKTEEQKAQARANIGADWSNAYWTLDAKTWLTGSDPYSANLWRDAMWTLDAKTWLTGSDPYSANLWRDAMWTLDAKTWLTGSDLYSANLWRDGQWITQADSWLSTKNIKKADGAARPLPKYLHALDFADSYTNDAAWYYNQPQDYGSCSAMRDGGFLYRNYDWKLDDAAEFVIRMSAGPGRFASVGVANVGTNLTEDIVTSGKWSRYYKCLPGRTVDGINENGVVAEVNVVDGDPQTSGWHDTGDLHPLAAVRWALDHGTNAQQAATYLAANIRFPAGWAQNFHWMIADERETWIVEDGSAHKETGKVVMTNFGLYPEYHYAQGWERWMILTNDTTSTITNVWFTHAYWQVSHPYRPNWDTDFNSLQEMYDAKSVWASHDKEQLRGKGFWQSVHTSVYDITNRVLRVAVQEIDDWYTFNMPITASNIGALTKESATKLIDEKVAANLNTFIDGETGVEYEGRFYGGSLYYVPTGNVYPPNN